MEKLRIGVIGAGRIGKLHVENMIRMPGLEVAAVSDLMLNDSLREWAAEIGIPSVTADYREIVQDSGIDAVFVCSSTNTHVQVIIEAAQAGKHIFCEKPLSFEPEQTRQALQAVEAAGVQLQVGFNRRFDHNFRRVKEMVEEGQVGIPHLIKITSRDPYPPSPEYIQVSGGLFMDMAIHDFDMARYLAGSEVVEVYAKGAVLVDPVIGELGDIDTAVVTLTFANGSLGIIDNSRKAVYGYDQRVEVFGSGGCATVRNDYPNSAELVTEAGVRSDKPLLFFLERYQQAYIEEVKQFADCVRSGRPVSVNGKDGLQAELIAHAAKRSLREGKPVRLEEV